MENILVRQYTRQHFEFFFLKFFSVKEKTNQNGTRYGKIIKMKIYFWNIYFVCTGIYSPSLQGRANEHSPIQCTKFLRS